MPKLPATEYDARYKEMTERLCSDNAATRLMACEWFGQNASWWSARLIRPLRRDSSPDVRAIATTTLDRFERQDPRYRKRQRAMLRNPSVRIRARAISNLAETGNSTDIDAILGLSADPVPEIRMHVLSTLFASSPDIAIHAARRMIMDTSEMVVACALTIMSRKLERDVVIDQIRDALPRVEGSGAVKLLSHLEEHGGSFWIDAIDHATTSPCTKLRAYATSKLSKALPGEALGRLVSLLNDPDDHVRYLAFCSLKKIEPLTALGFVVQMLQDSDHKIRCSALNLIRDVGRDEHRLHALRTVRHPHAEVRLSALRVIAEFDDPRVPGELISAIHDVDSDVSEYARGICLLPRSEFPAMRHMSDDQRIKTVKQRLEMVKQVRTWAERVGRELLGREVEMLRSIGGLGYTRPPKQPGGTVEIFVNDLPVSTGHRHGVQVMKGLVLHELGHHLYDIGVRGSRTSRSRARKMGLGNIYDLLTDERLERGLRSRRPAWGVYFDRLAAYAFAQRDVEVALEDYAKAMAISERTLERRIERRHLPGQLQADRTVLLGHADLLRIPEMLPLHGAFLVCLRCGFDPRLSVDPAVARAIDLVPGNLKQMDNRQLLDLSTRIGEIIGNDEIARRQMQQMRGRFRSSKRLIELIEQWILTQRAEMPKFREDSSKHPADPRKTTNRLRSQRINLDSSTYFNTLTIRKKLPFDPSAHAALVKPIRPHIRRLRAYLQQFGRVSVDQYGVRRGYRLDLATARRAAATGRSDLLVHRQQIDKTDAYLGLLIDRSASMRGGKIELARRIGALLAESARGLRGIEGHVSAFDDTTFFELGNLECNSIAGLNVGNGNNDAGGLAVAADLARRSRKRNKLLIVVSDGSPTDCSVQALQTLVKELADEGIVSAQAAVDRVDHQCFEHSIDLSKDDMDLAITRFGRMLMDLTVAWRLQ